MKKIQDDFLRELQEVFHSAYEWFNKKCNFLYEEVVINRDGVSLRGNEGFVPKAYLLNDEECTETDGQALSTDSEPT